MENRIIVLGGPTGIGKTELSLKLARAVNGEIISGDSMQIYHHMDIGSAKIKPEEMQGVVHHLLDFLDPRLPFSVAEYKALALNCVRDLHKRGVIPIITGGTGLFIDSVIKNLKFTASIRDEAFRKELESAAASQGNEYVHDLLVAVDPVSAERLHKNNLKRVIRALEVYKITGTPLSAITDLPGLNPDFRTFYYYLNMDRGKLYDRINARVDQMVAQGLEAEVKNLLAMGLTEKHQSMQGIGYKEMISHIHGHCSLDEAVSAIKQASRNYAKRQLTWFRNDPCAVELNRDVLSDDEILAQILQTIEIR